MNELSDLLQPLVDLAPPGPTVEELTQRVKARRRRRKLGFSGVTAVVILAAALAVALLVPTGSGAKVEVVGVPNTTSGVRSGQGQAGAPPSVRSGLKLAFTTQPGGGPSGSSWTTQPAVTVEDSGSNPTASTDSVTLAIASGPSGSDLTCNAGSDSVAAAGVARFSGCQIVGPVGAYTLTATDPRGGGVGPATSTSFAITVGAAGKLVFNTQPGGGPNGVAWPAQPAVTVEDTGGNPTTATDIITLAIATGPSGASLTCTGGPYRAATAGVATFSGCQVIGPAGTYTLTATDSTSGSVTPAASFVFTITAGAPTHLMFTTPPGGGPGEVAWATQPVVAIKDSGGNTVTTSTDTVSLAITNGPSARFTCSGGPPSVAATSGVATFSGCQITGPAVFYAITASDPPLSAATSTVMITP